MAHDAEKKLTPARVDEAKEWLSSQRNSMPAPIADTLAKLLSLYATLVLLQSSRQKMQTLLSQFFGLKSKSERGNGGNTSAPRLKGKKLTEEEKKARSEKIERKRAEDAAEVHRIYAESLALIAVAFIPVDQETWGEPFKAASESEKTTPADARADAKFVWNLTKTKPVATARPLKAEEKDAFRSENLYAFMQSSTMAKSEKYGWTNMTDPFPAPAGRSLQSDYHTRSIWDVDVIFTRTEATVQTVTDRITGERVTASVDLAPPNWQHSYRLIAFFVMMAVGFLIPMTRLSRMYRTSEKSFPVGTIWNMLRFAARCLEPVYKVLGTLVGLSGYIEGDDTGTKCHGMKKTSEDIEDEKKAKPKSGPQEDPDPFEEKPSLVEAVSGYLGRFFVGTQVDEKSGVHLSMVTGCSHGFDERSRIIFYRTHRGTVGDLLGALWNIDAAKKKRKVKFTCDLNSQNIPKEALRKHIDLTIGGCVAHLRRGFYAGSKLEAATDDCRYILQLIRRLYDTERMARDDGNTPDHIRWYRERYGKVLWDLIFEKVEEMSKKWLKGTGDLGDHIAYVLKNRKAFTVYLGDPRMPIDNNFSERNLRPEKTHMANSRHRMTEEGRVAYDILLTIIRTCACAQVAPQEWLVWVMQNRDKVAIAPEKYTPYQFHLMQKATRTSGG